MNSSSKGSKKLNDKTKLNVEKDIKKENFEIKDKNKTTTEENNPKHQRIYYRINRKW